MEVFIALVILFLIGWVIRRAIFGSPADQASAQAAVPPALPKVSRPPLFDLYRDARGNSTMFGFPVIFSSKLSRANTRIS